MVLVRSNKNPKATDILERLDRANGKTVGYAMGQMMYDNKTKGNIRYRVKDLVYDLETMRRPYRAWGSHPVAPLIMNFILIGQNVPS